MFQSDAYQPKYPRPFTLVVDNSSYSSHILRLLLLLLRFQAMVKCKLQALFYDILPPTTAMIDYVIDLENCQLPNKKKLCVFKRK